MWKRKRLVSPGLKNLWRWIGSKSSRGNTALAVYLWKRQAFWHPLDKDVMHFWGEKGTWFELLLIRTSNMEESKICVGIKRMLLHKCKLNTSNWHCILRQARGGNMLSRAEMNNDGAVQNKWFDGRLKKLKLKLSSILDMNITCTQQTCLLQETRPWYREHGNTWQPYSKLQLI